MKNSKLAIITDTHFGCHSNSVIWHNIMLEYGVWLKNKLQSSGINKIIIMGDFFDNRNEIGVETLSVASKFMDIFADFEITMLAGNHDMFYRNRNDVNSVSIFSGRTNINVISDITRENIGNLTATHLPWGCDISLLEQCDVIFGHLEVNGFYMMVGKAAEGKIDPKILLEKSDLIFSGHFHLRDERKFSKGKIIYVGSPYQLNWGEMSNIPGFYILDTDDKSYEFVENTLSPRHIKISATDIDTEVIKNNIVSVELGELTEAEQKTIRNTIYSASPLETRFTSKFNTIASLVSDIKYDQNVELIDVMFKFVDDLKLDGHSDLVKDKLKSLYEKYS